MPNKCIAIVHQGTNNIELAVISFSLFSKNKSSFYLVVFLVVIFLILLLFNGLKFVNTYICIKLIYSTLNTNLPFVAYYKNIQTQYILLNC